MSDADGMDNLAFTNEEDTKLENGGPQQVTLDQDSKSSGDGAPIENGHQRSFISQHYVEPIKPSSEPCYKTETRIELPADNAEKSVSEPKLNGVHGNGNNNDASFLNNSSTSVQVNDTGKKEQIEAVNLELVSMRPYTGNNIQTKGQEACEVPTDPYEEYFVPVNEHRKYIRSPEAEVETTVAGVRFDLGPGVGREGLSLRDPAAGLVDYSHWLTALRGEKLYVTKDKRSKNSHWRRMAWGCALLVIAIAVIIAILAATGVIFTQEATEPLTNVDENNANQFNEVHTAGSQEYVKNPPPSPPPLTSSFPPWPTTDETIRQTVANALDGILRLDDFNWSDELSDTKSRVYRQVSDEIEQYLGDILQQANGIKVPVIKVYDINKEGEVKFRISHSPMASPKESQKYIEETLRKNGNMIGQYHLSRLQVENLIDQCEYNNECTEKCKYDYSTGEFVCGCELGKSLSQDGKTCVEIDDITHSTESNHEFSEGRSRDPAQFEPSHPDTWGDFKTEWMETLTPEPKIKNVPEADQESSTTKDIHNFGDNSQWSHKHLHPSIETTELPEVSEQSSTTIRLFTTPFLVSEFSAEPEPTTESEPVAESEPTAEPEPTVKLEPSAKPEPEAESESSVELEPATEPEPTATSKSVSVSIVSSDSTTPSEIAESESTTVSEPTSEPTFEPISKSVPKQKPAAEPKSTVKSEIATEVVPIVEEESVTKEKLTTEPVPVTEPVKISNNVKSETIPYLITTQLNLESNTEIFNEPESVTKSISNDDTESSVTRSTLLNDTDTIDATKSLIDLPNENNSSENNDFPTTTMKINETPTIDDDAPLQVIPLIPKNDSTDMNDEITKMESTTSQSSISKDEISESTTIESDLTTLDYRDSKQESDENVTAIKFENNEESNTERVAESFDLPENKENNFTTEINLDESNIENKNFSNEEHDLTTEQQPSSISDQPVSIVPTTTPVTSIEHETEITTKFVSNDRYPHTIEINGVSKNIETHNNPKIYETTTTKATSIDTSTEPISSHNEEHVPQNALQSETQNSNEKNVIEHMPTTIFPKVPKNFAHNVEPLKEPITKSMDDEHIMVIPKSEEIHARIPELIPEQSSQSANESRQAKNTTVESNNGVVVKNSDTKQFVENTTSSTASSAVRNNENIDNNVTARSDGEVQEHSTNHPLHPAILPENSMVNSFAGKSDANDDRHAEDMSPFLPDVNREKEIAKKAPRLDKDEQDVPNPFETHIDDVITHRPLIHINADNTRHEVNKTKDLLNDVNLHASDEKTIDFTEKITESKANVNYMSNGTRKETIQNDLDNVTDVNNNTESDLQKTLQDDNSAISNGSNVTEDAIKNNNFSEDNSEILRVIPLADPTSQMNETSNEPDVSLATKKLKEEEEVKDFAIKNGAINSEKLEENAVEDQYNDITDENLSKEYKSKIISIKDGVMAEPKKAVLKDVDRVSYKDTSSLTNAFAKKRNDTNERTSSDAMQSSTTERTESILNNRTEDVKLTTQEPVLPIEIQQEMSTTVATDKVEVTTMIDEGKQQDAKQLNVTQPDDKEVTAAQTTTQSTLEAKTTAQVPILPEELQTTENDMLTTTTSATSNEEKEMKQRVVVDENESSENNKDETTKEEDTVVDTSERSMAATTVYESNVSVGSTRKMEDENSNEQSGTTTPSSSMEDAKIGTTPMTSTTERDTSDVTTTEDVRPVTEMVDDTPMIEFDYRNLFTTTPRLPLIESDLDEPSEEALTVIPLEKSQEGKKKSADKKNFDKYKYKKEKDLNLESQEEENVLTETPISSVTLSQTESPKIFTRNNEEVIDSAVSSEIDPNLPKFVLVDTEGNILPASKIKNIESTDKKIDTKLKNYPSFIPVSEDIIEPIPVTEPYMMKRNYTYPATASSGTPSAIANETIEGRTDDPETDLFHENTGAKETTEQPATFVSDQSFGDEETKVDRVTKKPTTIRLTVRTTPVSVESATIASSSLSKCTTGQFQCVNGTSRDGAYCVPLSVKCDSEKDCSDGSDEANCEGCPDNFRCASGQCLKRHLVCNKIADCNDGSDEQHCENWQCQSDEFKCPSGKCIPALWQCNDRPDCEDHRDEYNCAESCGNNEYLCPTEKWCIPQTWHCNGIAECADGEDEKLCDCSLDQFKCQTGGCISLTQICDGIENCPDYSDEWNCLNANVTADKNNLTNAATNIDADNNTTSGSTDRVPLLKIKQYNGDYQLVCWDGWSEEFSDSYCRALGFAGAEMTESSLWNQTEDNSILRLKTNPDHRQPLVTNLQQVEFCVSGKVVRVSCEEFACGMHYASEEPTARSIDGTSISDGQLPSVALLKEEKDGIACTASIIGPLHAVASYSCIYRNKKRSRWQLFTGNDMLKGYPVKNIVAYPQAKYNQFLYNNDIALIELEEPLVLSRNISAVCLPRQSIQPRQICVTAGWGFSVNGEINLQQYHKFLSLPTYDSAKCNATSLYAGFITEHDICADFTDTDKGSCYNDEGAPLMCVSESQNASERWEIQGLLSHRRCSKGPAIYSSTEPALSWLRETVPALRTQS